MKAAIFREVGKPLTIEDVEIGEMRANEVRIRVAASGLCHSDYHIIAGDIPCPVPVLLGHEASGIVEAVGENVQHFRPGDRVVSCLSGYCGECGECQTGHSNRCDNKPIRPAIAGEARITAKGEPIYQLGELGGFAEEMLVDARSLVKLPDAMPLDLAALLGCAVLTGVGAATNRVNIRAGESVAVIGCGGVGLNAIQGAKLAGAGRIIAIDLNPAKLELARQFGATEVIHGSAEAAEEVLELTGGGVDFAFEVVGLPATIRQAVTMLRKGGTAVLVGVTKFGTDLAMPAGPFIQKEINVVGSLLGSVPFQIAIPRLADLYLQGALKLEPLVSQKIALEDINRGYDQLAAGEIARSIITFDT
ncbi:Zn-dependent alcohol dehydrogenase [Novosphingobium malaysiense]|uniref:Alcohol dehydrogenase n=1 Tax=Novosphingobium malaysiense TaxID=1348853 RepID=A0A0B1ZVK2_9SPHN|nr:Zn-dependent alcohol dehydrogenase [Novosphingobium malaysiense]KHK93167.1 alcohol dehydrogenase [Novosphingobium malaysiense]